MAHVLDFLRAFALAHGLGEHIDCAEAFFEALQRQTGEHESVDVLGKLGPTATLLWTSAHRLNGVPVAHWLKKFWDGGDFWWHSPSTAYDDGVSLARHVSTRVKKTPLS